MAGQEAAQQKVVEIVKQVFEVGGFNIDFLNNPFMLVTAKRAQSMEDLLLSWKNSPLGNIADKALKKAEDSFNMFFELPCEEFNDLCAIEQFTLFLQVLNFVAYNNYADRAALLCQLCLVAGKYKDTEQDMVSARAWQLFIGLLLPEMAA